MPLLRPILFACLIAAPALAEDWRRLDDAGITAALAARVLQYQGGAHQNFFTDGRTLYEAGSGESWGKWWVADGEYCSTWPRSQTRSCYRVEAQGLDLRFTGTGGDVSIGRYVDL